MDLVLHERCTARTTRTFRTSIYVLRIVKYDQRKLSHTNDSSLANLKHRSPWLSLRRLGSDHQWQAI